LSTYAALQELNRKPKITGKEFSGSSRQYDDSKLPEFVCVMINDLEELEKHQAAVFCTTNTPYD